MKPTWGNHRVYHRRLDTSNEWRWADHGHPERETVPHVGPAFEGKFFVTSSSGKLYERHWRADLGQWVWENHGFG